MTDVTWKEIRDATLVKRDTLSQSDFAAMMTTRHGMRRDMNSGGTTTLQDIFDFVTTYAP